MNVAITDVAADEALWNENSNGLVEVTVNKGMADSLLGLSIGITFEIIGFV